MNSLKIYYITSILLILVGIIISPLIYSEKITTDLIDIITNILANIATIIGIFVAYFALNSWQSQYRHKKLDNLIDDLEDSFIEYHSAMVDLNNAILLEEKASNSKQPVNSKNKINDRNKFKLIYFKNKNLYKASYNKLKRVYQINQNSVVSPRSIERINTNIFQGLYSIYNQNFTIANELLTRNTDRIIKLHETCSEEFNKLRKTF